MIFNFLPGMEGNWLLAVLVLPVYLYIIYWSLSDLQCKSYPSIPSPCLYTTTAGLSGRQVGIDILKTDSKPGAA
jgi:hypothetical protein